MPGPVVVACGLRLEVSPLGAVDLGKRGHQGVRARPHWPPGLTKRMGLHLNLKIEPQGFFTNGLSWLFYQSSREEVCVAIKMTDWDLLPQIQILPPTSCGS